MSGRDVWQAPWDSSGDDDVDQGFVDDADRADRAAHGGAHAAGWTEVRSATPVSTAWTRIRCRIVAAFVVTFIIAALVLAVIIPNHTTLLLVKDNPPTGYLPVSEYRLVQPSTNEPIGRVRSWDYPSQRTFKISDGAACSIDGVECDHALRTSRGIQPGSSWNDFVKAYGDMTAHGILVQPNDDDDYRDYMSDEDRGRQRGLLQHDETTIADFDSDYIRTGRISLAENSLTVTFRAGFRGMKVLYTADEQWQGWLESSEKRRWHIGRRSGEMPTVDVQHFTLEFTFGSTAQFSSLRNDGDLYSISSRR